ncbi:hypothetical protein [Stieleria mannarensis]|uniref:hypothetical protein n=1 Tax=Stieleria mannarensis TaxID=2755585 RepID=UPI0015FFA159|nr:hypothetical protein [Rhodopirellula sp. JC639]
MENQSFVLGDGRRTNDAMHDCLKVFTTSTLILALQSAVAAESSGDALPSPGFWRITESQSSVRVQGKVRKNDPHWRYILITEKSIITFYKAGDPWWHATTAHVKCAKSTAEGWIVETADAQGVQQTWTLQLGDNATSIKLRRTWSQNEMEFESERRLERVSARSETEFMDRFIENCRFLADEEGKRIVQRYNRRAQRAP